MAIGAVVAIIAAAVTAYAAYEQGQTQSAIAKYNAKVAQNAALAKRHEAKIAADNERERNQKVLAAQRAALGASGVLPSEGTPLLVQTNTAETAALNEARIRYSGEVGARQFEAEQIGQSYIAQRAREQGYVNAGTSLLSGVAGGYSTYSRGRGRTTAT